MQPTFKQEEILPLFTGATHEIFLPSGRLVTIRETNGNDDEILSKLSDASGDGVINFLANIVLKDSYLGDKPQVSHILDWHASDKYYLLFKQRLINRGSELEFKHECQNPKCPSNQPHFDSAKVTTYQQDLNLFDGDLKNPEFKPHENQPHVYPHGKNKEVEFVISSQKKFKISILTSILEKVQLEQPVETITKNTVLTARNLQVWSNQQWVPIKYFGPFSSKELSEVRKQVMLIDPLFDPVVSFNCQYCGQSYRVPLLGIPVFFWPEDLM